MRQARSGFTIVEVLVAVTILTVGVMALASSSAMVTRMIGRGKIDTRATQLATREMERLRLAAYTASPRCTGLANGGPQVADKITISWTVVAAGTGRTLNVIASYATPRGTRTDTLTTHIEC
jgi:prepilin-type N-terminal cleavage/methylation domain-containing protein